MGLALGTGRSAGLRVSEQAGGPFYRRSVRHAAGLEAPAYFFRTSSLTTKAPVVTTSTIVLTALIVGSTAFRTIP